MSVRHKPDGGVYVWRTRKPHALIGLPIIGRHVGYVGKTNSFRRRGGEHLEGSTRYEKVVLPKSWTDLEPRVHEIPLPDAEWVRSLAERVLIAVLCPVYNVQLQPPWNLRKISLKRAKAQRFARDQFGATARLASAFIRYAIYAALAMVAYFVWIR